MNTSAEEEVGGAASITTEKCVEFPVCLCQAETKTTIWSITDTDRIAN